jgi:hypothetical protein
VDVRRKTGINESEEREDDLIRIEGRESQKKTLKFAWSKKKGL